MLVCGSTDISNVKPGDLAEGCLKMTQPLATKLPLSPGPSRVWNVSEIGDDYVKIQIHSNGKVFFLLCSLEFK